MNATLWPTPSAAASTARSANAAKPERVLSTLNADGSRRWLRPRPSPGRFLSARRFVAWALIAIFAAIPFIHVNGKPAILLDLATRRFHILGATFLPTDTVLLALLLVGTFITVFLATALLGRVWCGWACPQTVYMEFVFRPIERFFDGTSTGAGRRGFRGSAPATVCKYIAYLAVSLFLAHTFLSYFVGVEQLAVWVRRSPFEHPAGFLIVASVTALMLFDFGFFREQTCIVACPYGRFQSVMLDRQSLIISYDQKRGEPRGKAKASRPLPVLPSSHGDCIDCFKCVTTCPTGIDIRDGLQMECIGCAQCIDACDDVMDRIGRPRGLIRYSSQAAMAGEKRRMLRPRVVVYPLVLIIVASLFGLALARRGDADVTVLRGLGRTFIELPTGEIANPVRIKVVNRSALVHRYAIEVEGVPGARVKVEAADARLEPGQTATLAAMVIAPFEAFAQGKLQATIVVRDDGEFIQRMPWRLMGPGSRASSGASQKGPKP